MQLPIEISIPKNYTVREVILAAIEQLNVKVVHYRLMMKADLFELTIE